MGQFALVAEEVKVIGGSGAAESDDSGEYWQTAVWHHEGSTWKLLQAHFSEVAAVETP